MDDNEDGIKKLGDLESLRNWEGASGSFVALQHVVHVVHVV